jgi:AraC-like DNA-binding protein
MPPVPTKDTVSIYFVRAAVSHLGDAARARCLAAAGIPTELLQADAARVTAPAFSTLWLATAKALDDEFFGLDHRKMKVGSFALLCQAALDCVNLDRALRRMLRGFTLFLDDVCGELSIADGVATVRVLNRIADAADRQFADETFLVLLHGLMCWLVGRRIVLQRLEMAHPRPRHAREYNFMFSEHVVFDTPCTAIHFDAALLMLPGVQTAATLRDFLATAPQSVFLKYKNEDSWTARLRRRLRASLGGDEPWPVFEAVAAEFGSTPTTLRRRLEAEGTSYQDIKDQLRSDLAIDLLSHGTLSIDDIGARLGFQDASAFHRAFKRWNGLQPGQYRLQRRRELEELDPK